LVGYLGGTLPNEMPAESMVVETQPGTVWFLPRGYWHSTVAHEDCIAIDFAIDPPCWTDYALSLFRVQLLRIPMARESVFGLLRGGESHQEYLHRRETLLFSLQDLLRTVASWKGTTERSP